MDRMTPREMLAKLVSFDTTSSKSNLPLIDWVEHYLAHHDVAAFRVPSEDGEKANIYARIGPEAEGGVVLSGHTDVVPVTGQDWETDPWTVVERDGKLYGRGTCDMKGFLAVALAHVPQMLEARLKRPIYLALSYDEEVGCMGVIPMVEEIAAAPMRPAACIVGEPTEMRVVTGQKGSVGFFTHVRGYEVHSSLVHKGVSAVMEAARLVEWHRLTMAEEAARAEPGCPYDPPYTTLHVGTIEGGTAGNITARDCHFQTDIRILPGQTEAEWDSRYRAFAAAVEAEMKARRPECFVDVSERMVVPPLEAEPEGQAEALARRLTGDNSTNVVSYQTEAGHFQRAGISTVICGPGSIEQAHQANEYITVEQFEAGARFIRDLIAELAR